MNHRKHLDIVPLDMALSMAPVNPKPPLTLDSPAMEVVSDFHHSPAPLLESSTPVDDAEELMRREHCNFKLVISAGDDFRGILALIDIRSSRLMRVANATGIPRSELTVDDIMIPRQQLHAITYASLLNATVGEVLAAMQELGERFLLVIERDRPSLCGLLSVREISERLHLPSVGARRPAGIAAIRAALHA